MTARDLLNRSVWPPEPGDLVRVLGKNDWCLVHVIGDQLLILPLGTRHRREYVKPEDLVECHRLPEGVSHHMYIALQGPQWSTEWPTEPGNYLFYGNYKGQEPELKLCHVSKAGGDLNPHIARIADGAFLYEGEQEGVFKPLRVETP